MIETLASDVPTLAEMSEFALKNFLSGKEKFLLQIEGGRVDHGAHGNDAAGLLWDQLAFDETISKVIELIGDRDDILVVITSDHGNANPGLNGTGREYGASNKAFARVAKMTASYEAILEAWKTAESPNRETLTSLISSKLGFNLKPKEADALLIAFKEAADIAKEKALRAEGKRSRRIRVSNLDWSNQLNNIPGLLGQFAGNHTGIGWTGTSHTSDPTMISAIGPQAERFNGIVPNHVVHRHFVELLG